jgi:integrase/recombinase XerD
MKKPPSTNALAHAVHGFLGEYVPELRGLSRHTLLSYRDTLVLLLRFIAKSLNTEPVFLDLKDISTDNVLAFLNNLEEERHNKISSRNVRLAAIHSFFRYVSFHAPENIVQAQRILGIPFKRAGSRPIDYLEYDEMCAVLSSIDRTTTEGRRDYALISLMFNTGARVQEMVSLGACDLQLESPLQVKLFGKGQKARVCPIWPQTAQVLKAFVAEAKLDLRSNAAVFCNHRGGRLTRFGIRYIVAKYCRQASGLSPSLAGKRLHPHSVRHSCAVYLLKSGVDLASISHWLGHASMNTTNRYATADLEMKKQTISRAGPPAGSNMPIASWRKDASIIEWLESL